MKKQLLAGIDVGTTGTKTILFDTEGSILASAYQEYSCIYPKTGWVEQDPEMLFAAVCSTCRAALEQITDPDMQVVSVSLSAQRSCVLFLDEANQPLKMISWLDNRAIAEAEEIADQFGREKFYEITGLPLCATWILPKILHTRKNFPELGHKTRRLCQLHDYILYRLGAGDFFGNVAEGGFWGLWDNRSLNFSRELMDCFQIPEALLPRMRRTGEPVGTISAEAAEKSGLGPDVLLCVGAGDQNSAALGAGVVSPGSVSISLGTGGLATVVLDGCYRDPNGQAMVTSHACQGLWTFEGLQNAAAGVFRWFRDEIAALEKSQAAASGTSAYDRLNEMIAQTPVGARGLLLLPQFAGSAAPRWNASARGAFLGLTLSHTRADMARACIEGITLEQKDILHSLKAAGKDFSFVRIVGGATNSEIWNQIQADVYGLACETLEVSDAAAVGAAISAGVGCGIFRDIREGAGKMVHVRKRYEPNPENVKGTSE